MKSDKGVLLSQQTYSSFITVRFGIYVHNTMKLITSRWNAVQHIRLCQLIYKEASKDHMIHKGFFYGTTS